jgi:hypothetical protein
MKIAEIMGYVALVLNIWGNLALTKKSAKGWLIRLACNFSWVAYSAFFAVWPLLINHVIFAGINIYGWFKWQKTIHICKCGREYDLTTNIYGSCICEMPIPH